ncbi:DUF2188 domain-containing protein [Actinomycetospora sp. CA-084318]|uniref:DUF2188 domain-containing protein n=1 Tax=Actinomycetospora sp. CA-084318 TaxID=3239892 RepID=UPI003D99810C
MSDRHVRAVDDGWAVEKTDASRASAVLAVQAEAITRAVEIVANDGGGDVIVHDRDGKEVERRAVARDADDAAAVATELAAAVTGKKGKETAKAAGKAVKEDAQEIGADARTVARKTAGQAEDGAEKARATAAAAADGVKAQVDEVRSGDKSLRSAAQDVSSIARTTGGQIADQADRTGRQIAGEARGLGRRAAAVVGETAGEAGEELVDVTDRAAREGARAQRELDSVADRTGNAIHAATEAAATPFDRLAALLNPVRVTGRVVGAVATGGLRLVGLGAAKGGEQANRGARRLANR